MSDTPTFLISADWGKHEAKRKAFVGSVAESKVFPLDCDDLCLRELLKQAGDLKKTEDDVVLVSIDVALGIPNRFLTKLQKRKRWAHVSGFLSCLKELGEAEAFWHEVNDAESWTLERPFISIPPGPGSKKSFESETDLLRDIDRLCGSNSPWIVSGIPGSVGSGSRAFWQELVECLDDDKEFTVWPFDGSLAELILQSQVVVAESYPAISYTVALESTLPAAKLIVSKTRKAQREQAIQMLKESTWIKEYGVQVQGLQLCRESEDCFDAMMACAAQLRCILENRAIAPTENSPVNLVDPVIEGGILLSSLINFEEKGKRLQSTG